MRRRGFLSLLAGGVAAGSTGAGEGIAAVIADPARLKAGRITATKIAAGCVLYSVDIDGARIGVIQIGKSNVNLGPS